MAIYGPSMAQGMTQGIALGMGLGVGLGRNIVNGGWPGKQRSPDQAKLFGPNKYSGGLASAKQANPAQAALSRATAENLPMLMRWMGMPPSTQYGTHTTANVVSPGQTQVIRPSAQPVARRAEPAQAGASSSLITSTPSPAEVALAATTLLGG